jgi:hypothetical protein
LCRFLIVNARPKLWKQLPMYAYLSGLAEGKFTIERICMRKWNLLLTGAVVLGILLLPRLCATTKIPA